MLGVYLMCPTSLRWSRRITAWAELASSAPSIPESQAAVVITPLAASTILIPYRSSVFESSCSQPSAILRIQPR